MNSFRQVIPGSTGPIFTKFSPCGRYLIVDYWSDPIFRSLKRRCHRKQFYRRNRPTHLHSSPCLLHTYLFI